MATFFGFSVPDINFFLYSSLNFQTSPHHILMLIVAFCSVFRIGSVDIMLDLIQSLGIALVNCRNLDVLVRLLVKYIY